jgi:hypothetical protein
VHHSLLSAFRASFGHIESCADLDVYITLVFHFSVHFVHHSLLSVFRASFISQCISCIIHSSVHFVDLSLLCAFRASFGHIESGAELAVYITLVIHFSVHFVHHSLLSAFRASFDHIDSGAVSGFGGFSCDFRHLPSHQRLH